VRVATNAVSVLHLGGQDKHGDTGHRDELEDGEHPTATELRRIAMRMSIQRVTLPYAFTRKAASAR
jgi:hypothetical protein